MGAYKAIKRALTPSFFEQLFLARRFCFRAVCVHWGNCQYFHCRSFCSAFCQEAERRIEKKKRQRLPNETTARHFPGARERSSSHTSWIGVRSWFVRSRCSMIQFFVSFPPLDLKKRTTELLFSCQFRLLVGEVLKYLRKGFCRLRTPHREPAPPSKNKTHDHK